MISFKGEFSIARDKHRWDFSSATLKCITGVPPLKPGFGISISACKTLGLQGVWSWWILDVGEPSGYQGPLRTVFLLAGEGAWPTFPGRSRLEEDHLSLHSAVLLGEPHGLEARPVSKCFSPCGRKRPCYVLVVRGLLRNAKQRVGSGEPSLAVRLDHFHSPASLLPLARPYLTSLAKQWSLEEG